eukprot:7218630-Alexandrium_andersonii.AAC.1
MTPRSSRNEVNPKELQTDPVRGQPSHRRAKRAPRPPPAPGARPAPSVRSAARRARQPAGVSSDL